MWRSSLLAMMSKINKRGVLGKVMVAFIATLVIVVILVVFALISGAVKTFGGIEGGVKVDKIEQIESINIFSSSIIEKNKNAIIHAGYNLLFEDIVEMRRLISGGKSFDQAKLEVKKK